MVCEGEMGYEAVCDMGAVVSVTLRGALGFPDSCLTGESCTQGRVIHVAFLPLAHASTVAYQQPRISSRASAAAHQQPHISSRTSAPRPPTTLLTARCRDCGQRRARPAWRGGFEGRGRQTDGAGVGGDMVGGEMQSCPCSWCPATIFVTICCSF